MTQLIGDIFTDLGVMNFLVRRLELTKIENEHDQAVLTVQSSSRSSDYSTLVSNRIWFSYGNPGRMVVFQGYVSEVGPRQVLTGQQYLVQQEVTCLGPTMVMKGNYPRFLVDITASDFIAQIATDNGLGFHSEFVGDSTQWHTLAQTSETDWQMAVQLANRVGAHIVATRGVLRLIDYNDISARELPTHFFQMSSEVPYSNGQPTGYITDFTPVNASTADPMYRTPALAYLQDGQTVYVPSTGRQGVVSRRFATDMPARTAQEATTLQSGYYLPYWSQSGGITVVGDSSIEPATICSVAATSGQNLAVMRPDYDGMWYVNTVKHIIYANQFFSVLSLGRTDRASNWYQSRSFWMGDKRGAPYLIPAGDGTWLSSWRTAA
jgi:hypothetical protein